LRRSEKRGFLRWILLGFLVAAGGYYVYTSKSFERQPPRIAIEKEIYWNLKEPLKILISDESGIKSYKVFMQEGDKRVAVDMQTLPNPKKRVEIKVEPPVELDFDKKEAELVIEAVDGSFWNYFLGNRAQKRVLVHVDTKKPDLFVVNNSYAIVRGGSALVIFYCNDRNLDDFYVTTSFGKRFAAAPFYKEGYYVALIAWPLTQESFRADIVAIDKAKNRSRVHIPLYLKKRRYRVSRINLSDRFLEGKVAELAEEFPETKKMDKLQRFKFINETLRAMNEKLIHTLSQKVPQERVESFDIAVFYPLKNGARVADFGDHRFYYYKGKLVSESYHLGLDLASTKMAPVIASNGGEVVFADFNGIYGNMPLISHGLGLYTLYAHCSTLFVKKGENIEPKSVIAKTGQTGLALGDHLHFGVLVQGVEVRPQEWMDRRWIKLNVQDVIAEAKRLIDSK